MISEVAPAARASLSRSSQPWASKSDEYVIGISGTSISARVSARHSRQRAIVIPSASARSAARRMTGPSASGSEKGNPSSITSAPDSTAMRASSGVSRPDIR